MKLETIMRFAGAVMMLLLLGLIALAVSHDEPEEDLYLKHHCEMVYLFHTSKGQYGWPDYNNTAHLCVETK